jgi:predicted AAA+ superfamily ATPase
MERLFTEKLKAWKRQEKPLPLMLVGARQTGKTWLLKTFCSADFENQVYVNFSENSDYKQFFQPSLQPEAIVSRIELFFNRKIDVEKTVFFFDEIQDCEEAIASLKYFVESESNYRVITAGSLLGVKLNRFQASFPVGKVQIEYLYPMNFEEFLWAMEERMLADAIRNAYSSNVQLPEIIHRKAIELYKNYLCVGGMPGAVVKFIENGKNLLAFDTGIAASILTGYLADMAKYSGESNALKINKVYQSIPAQLAKGNTKFRYNLVENAGKKEKFQTSIEWLLQANMLLACNKIETPQSPLSAYRMDNHFKLYLSNTGLLVSLAGIRFYEIMQESVGMYSGFLTENYVAQTLYSKGMKLYYWESNSQAEIDFILHLQDGIIPVEVKASANVRSKSLQSYLERYNPPYVIRVSARNFGFVNRIQSVPLYAVHCIG